MIVENFVCSSSICSKSLLGELRQRCALAMESSTLVLKRLLYKTEGKE